MLLIYIWCINKIFLFCTSISTICYTKQNLQKLIDFLLIIEKIQNPAKKELDQDTNYDAEIAVQNIHEYIKHLTIDSQQKKAKSEAFEKLGESAGFRLQIFFKI